MRPLARLLLIAGFSLALLGSALSAAPDTALPESIRPEPLTEQAAAEPLILTITAAGDVTHGSDRRKTFDPFGRELAQQGDDLAFPFRNVQAYFAADDLTIVNYEGALTERPPATDNTYCFAGPPSYAQALALGHVEAVALDNNHVFDHGTAGYADTQQALREAGIAYAGNGEAAVIEIRSVKIGLLAYRTFDGRYPVIHEQMPGDIAALREQGCALVIVSYHWGEERKYAPHERQIKLGRATIDAGADLVLGHHSHVINPIEYYQGKYICYSLANFSFGGNTNPKDKDTFLFQQRFAIVDGAVQDAGMRIVPCRVSSLAERNDFIPTPYEAVDAKRLAAKLVQLGKGLDFALTEYPLDWASNTP